MANWTNKQKLHDLFITPNKISIGDEQNRPIFISRSVKQEMVRNENDPKDDDYELLIIKYDANHDALIEQKERTTKHEEDGPITPS